MARLLWERLLGTKLQQRIFVDRGRLLVVAADRDHFGQRDLDRLKPFLFERTRRALAP